MTQTVKPVRTVTRWVHEPTCAKCRMQNDLAHLERHELVKATVFFEQMGAAARALLTPGEIASLESEFVRVWGSSFDSRGKELDLLWEWLRFRPGAADDVVPL